MAYPIRPAEGLTFKPTNVAKKFYQKWDETNRKFIKSDVWIQGLSPKYILDLRDGSQIEISRDMWSQALVSAEDINKNWRDCTFVIKTNKKTGKDIRYFVNIARDDEQRTTVPREEVEGHDIDPSDHY